MRLPHFLKSPLSWSAILLFGVAFNLHVADMGETYVARNLSAWAVIGVSLMALWGPKLRRGQFPALHG